MMVVPSLSIVLIAITVFAALVTLDWLIWALGLNERPISFKAAARSTGGVVRLGSQGSVTTSGRQALLRDP